MAREMPFDEDIMTIFMGMGDPEKPGMHGRNDIPAKPETTAFEFVCQIRDMCEEFIKNFDKEEPKPEKENEDELQENAE